METQRAKTNFEQLQLGCSLRSVQKENGEPENIAVGQVSKELRFFQRQSQYVGEIERVTKELQLTTSLIKNSKDREVPEGVSRQELLAYHQGNFLTLVHQMKDKVMQLINLITETETPEKPSIEEDISVSDLLRKKGKKLQALGIEDAVKEWRQEDPDSKIAVVLRKRTSHHHRVSGLRYDMDFLNLGFADIASGESFQNVLSDYGKEQIAKMRAESSERLFSGAVTKAKSTLSAIEQNIDVIAAALVKHFKLPVSNEEVKEIIDGRSTMLTSFDVVNLAAVEKIPQPAKEILDRLLEKMLKQHGKEIVSVYVVGSLSRGEFEEGYSDMNVYVILRLEGATSAQTLHENPMVSLRHFTRAGFLSEESKKFRIIAKSDGVLFFGEDLLKDEKMPKAGLLLALTLNDDILETLDRAKAWIGAHPTAPVMLISIKSRRIAKRILDFMYGVVVSNKPQFTSSRKERLEKMNEAFPENKGLVDTLMQITRHGVGDPESFTNLIDGFRPKAEVNLKKMQDVKDATQKK